MISWTEDAYACARRVKLIIFDVDGTLTDGGIYIGEDGELFKAFHCQDGFGLSIAHEAGLLTAILTGRTSKQTVIRAKEVKIDAVYQGYRDKRSAYAELKKEYHLADEEIAYVGDDIIDLPVMLQVGFPAAVANAADEVKAISKVVAARPGGRGGARDVIEFLLKAQGRWEKAIAPFYDVPNAQDVRGLAQ